ncbi:MAG: hypothetical protein KIT54_12185 [Phycisphaeraceae bacterium]|nr:hypothetical protein [Phycisphaeraceae bacterium]
MDETRTPAPPRRRRPCRATEPPEWRRRELVNLLGAGLARVIERSDPGGDALSDSSAARVELPGDAGLSVVAGGVPAGRGSA